ncbi:hypothetical protein A4X09_0g7219 [Tilletia walkeri]|uniref:RlpA-like protein double-psi beta-barrel domain-containing protein n=1 Tax=Tilletia walkeri TaxID=117179 RepID=A0A8X7N3N4_9BASI|nr:hypothetical protein A4X09_0g7219 [Tilletia walkeri]
MRASVLFPAALLALAASSVASNSHNAIRRPSLPRRLDSAPDSALSDPIVERGLLDALWRRFTGRATWYGVGVTMGACGKWTTPDTRAVALNIQLYGNPDAQSAWCGKKLRITKGGRTSIATVVDCCPTCPGDGDLDMSKILFQDFAGLDAGIFQMSWSLVGDNDNDDGNSGKDNRPDKDNNNNNNNNNKNNDDDDEKDKPKPKPKPTPTPTPKPKPTPTATKTTTKTKTTKTTKSESSTSTSSESESESEATSTANRVKKPKQTSQRQSKGNNIANLSNAISGLRMMVHAGNA